MSDIFERKPQVNDEVTAIELAAICVRRWRLMLTVFLCIVVATLGYVLTLEREYKFESLYSLASWSDDRYVINPDSAVALLNGKVWPETRAQHEFDGAEALAFDVSVSVIAETSLIRITSYAGELSAAAVKNAHQQLFSYLAKDESAKEANIKSSIGKRVSQLETYVEKIEQSGLGRDQLAPIYEELMKLKAKPESLISGGVQVLAARSSTPVGPGRGILLLVGLMGGIVGGVIATLVAEFFSRVRVYLIDSKER